ncbi:hypothetical protein HDF16_003181 [Granulicella aggregans]|uniref:Uncharacterized protein n=1 Tax=Granulicella aggregans TaxID=474949 RepID=A0A7W7ZES7_9BACT|nr:hypothetical protein [Granulicella aggregans]MBB5058467.1 hypothetical protein [Granulicella aggregans]
MRQKFILAIALLPAVGLRGHLHGQMHKVAKPEDVVRAVGVYEWIGDRTKPTATRLIPVSLYIDDEFQDAGVYLSRPVPFALDIGTIYEVDKSGVPGGNLELISARRLKPVGDTDRFDDGWVGYGKFAVPKVKKGAALKPSTATATITSDKADKDSDRPTFARRVDHTEAGSKSSATPTAGSPVGGSPAPPDDPDRPHLSKKPDATSPAATDDKSAPTDTTADKTPPPPVTSGNPSPDADRPTLRKRSPEEAKKARKEADQSSARGLATSLNDDPDRPTLRRGRGQQELVEGDLPLIKGVPLGLNQAVAVSDASNRPVHDFSRPWEDDAERTTVLGKMQALAQAQLTAYAATNAPAAKPATPPAKTAAKKPISKLRHAKVPESVTPTTPLLDEQLNGYTLSYGGAATYVYTAHTDGEGETLRYVTIVAQRDTFGELKPAIQSVTDAAHLDRTPWMRIVDAVDADASNRASLLFELRGQSARQFALYRVIATRPEQIFLTGTTQ